MNEGIESNLEIIVGEQARTLLAELGLSSYVWRAEVSFVTSRKMKITIDDGLVAFEIDRSMRIEFLDVDAITELPEMVKSMRARGFDL